jgi:hypothetical protein
MLLMKKELAEGGFRTLAFHLRALINHELSSNSRLDCESAYEVGGLDSTQ